MMPANREPGSLARNRKSAFALNGGSARKWNASGVSDGRLRIGCGSTRYGLTPDGQMYAEHCADADGGFHVHRSTVRLDESLHSGEAESHPTDGGMFAADKGLEHPAP